jgi:hypothetical protein
LTPRRSARPTSATKRGILMGSRRHTTARPGRW